MLSLLLAASPAASPTPDITLNNGVRMPAIAAGYRRTDLIRAEGAKCTVRRCLSSCAHLLALKQCMCPRRVHSTWQYTSDEAQRSAVAALQAGLTHIDTASDYCADGSTGDCSSKGGSNQRGISKALQGKPRASYFLTTKVPGCGLQGISRTACGEDSVAAADRNLAELGLDHVDLLLIHFPPEGGCGAANCALIRKQWRALVHSHLSTNKTRALGVCMHAVARTWDGQRDADASPVIAPRLDSEFLRLVPRLPRQCVRRHRHPRRQPVRFPHRYGSRPGGACYTHARRRHRSAGLLAAR
jgi:hypothetical protein